MKVLRELLKLVQKHKLSFALAIILSVFTVASNVGLLTLSALLISWAALHPPILDLMTVIVGVRFFGIARALFRYLERYVAHDTTFKLLKELRVWVYSHLEPLAPAGLQYFKRAQLLNSLMDQVETLQKFYLRVLAPPATALVLFFITLGFLAGFHWKLALIYGGFYLLAGLGIPWMLERKGRGLGQKLVEAKSRLHVHLLDCLQGMMELKIFDGQKSFQRKAKDLGRELTKWQEKEAGFLGLSRALTGLMAHLALWSLLVVAISLVEGGQVPGIYLAMLVLGAFSSFEAVEALPLLGKHWGESQKAAQSLFKLTERPPAVPEPPKPKTSFRDYSLEIKNLSFRYEKEGPWVLKGLNLKLPAGGRLALVGPSGGGKSTLVNLLLRFWDYEQGEILLGGRQLKEFSSPDLRKLFSVVSQNTYLFNATIKENLLLAKPEATEEEIYYAARKASLHEFILSLPQGYDTYVGEQGMKFSGGQRQRLALARALLKDAPILILDEATIGLDAVTQRQLWQQLEEVMAGKTTLVITHWLIGLDKMDQILVLKKGMVVEQGRQRELLAQDSFYRRMWELQHQVLAWERKLCYNE